MDTKVLNAGQGKVFYGLHFYPGLAQYDDGKGPYRVFLNEDTLRKMDPTFAGRPIFVEHVDEVDPDLNELRKEAEGWVVESFYNAADGCHWVKFIVVTDNAERAIRNGFRLSNAYLRKAYKDGGGLWNGIPYEQEITDGEYEHLALVQNPRYEESVVMTPEEFKQYNEQKLQELKKLSNSKEKGKKMNLSFWKKTKVENPIDTDLQVVLPKSGKSISLTKLINDYDQRVKNGYEKMEDPAMEKHSMKDDSGHSDMDAGGESAKHHAMANMDHMVKMHDGSYMKIKDMMSKHKDMCDELEEMKKGKPQNKEESELDLKVKPEGVDAEGDLHNYDETSEHGMDEHEEKVAEVEHEEEKKDSLLENPEEVVHDEDEEDEKKKSKLQLKEKSEGKEMEDAKAKNKKKNDLEKANRLKNAHLRALQNEVEPQEIVLSYDMVNKGKQRYGS